MSRQTSQKIAFAILTALAVVVGVPIVLGLVYIVFQGIGAISWEFLTEFPRNGMKEGGILPAGMVTPKIAEAVMSSPAVKILLPLSQENVAVVGVPKEPLPHLVQAAVGVMMKEVQSNV